MLKTEGNSAKIAHVIGVGITWVSSYKKFKQDTCIWTPTWSRADWATNSRAENQSRELVIDTIKSLIVNREKKLPYSMELDHLILDLRTMIFFFNSKLKLRRQKLPWRLLKLSYSYNSFLSLCFQAKRQVQTAMVTSYSHLGFCLLRAPWVRGSRKLGSVFKKIE